jgi:thiamine-phosphate pyrophosphorylase
LRPSLYVLTDPAIDHERTTRAIAAALSTLQNRMGVVVRDADEAFARRIAAMCRDAGAWCFVKADEALVQRAGATGPHLGAPHHGAWARHSVARPDRNGAYTASAHDVEEAKRAADAEAIFVGPIFDVPGKGPARGLDLIRGVKAALPDANLYALGGITPENAAECIAAGARGVAVIRAVLGADDPAAAARAIVGAIRA